MHPAGRLFETIIDGYFPLAGSVRQGLDRLGLEAAVLLITQAPILHLPDSDTPVPMRLPKGASGLIRRFLGLARRQGADFHLIGAADWIWDDASPRPLTAATRLAEPVFLRGIGLSPGKAQGQGQFWGFGKSPAGIENLKRFGRANLCLGTLGEATGPGLWLDITDPATRARAARMAAEFGG